MGMAASQGRLLCMTARLSNNEFEQQSVAYSKQKLADDSQDANNKYLDAMNSTKYQILTGYNGNDAIYEDVTYSQLTGVNTVAVGKQYIVSDKNNRILVTETIANAFETAQGDFNRFLEKVNPSVAYTQIDADAKNITEDDIHNAWDKYLVSVGKSINDGPNSLHILGFSFNTEKNAANEDVEYPTYNNAYAQSTDGTHSAYLKKDTEGSYYMERYPVSAQEYLDEFGNIKFKAVYQTSEQVGTNDFTELLNVTVTEEKDSEGYSKYLYTYQSDDKGNHASANSIFVSVDGVYTNGTPVISKQQNEKINSFGKSEDNPELTYVITDSTKVIAYEGTTSAQRELYDYAVALSKKKNDINNELVYDKGLIGYYKNIYNQMITAGYTTYSKLKDEKLITTKEQSENKVFKDDAWLINQLKKGVLTISYYSATEKDFIKTTLDDDESITEREDKTKIAIAEQEYKNSMDKIEDEDKRFDMMLNKLESEHTALQTEYESVSKVISKNIEKSYNVFNA